MRDHLVFYVNGTRHQIHDASAFLSLAEFLRDREQHVGTKVVCNEGDCGACTVLLGRHRGAGDTLTYHAIDACIIYLFQLDGKHVVTIEGLGNLSQLTPIQSALIDCHGSQCGFCTPGFVMAMHGVAECHASWEPKALRYELSGNLCRCTGYTSILAAGKKVACQTIPSMNTHFPPKPMIAEFSALATESVYFSTSAGFIAIPKTFAAAVVVRSQNPQAVIVNGATDYGVLRNHQKIECGDTLCLTDLQDFSAVEIIDHQLVIQGGATWYAIEECVKSRIPQYHSLLTRFGSPQIRKMGTLAGNLASGSPIADAVPFHLVLGAELELVSTRGSRRIALDDFYVGYRQTALQPDELIRSMTTPLPQVDETVKLYKVSKRHDMDISTATFGMWLRFTGHNIVQARLAMGGVGPTVMRLPAVEKYLVGKTLSEDIFREAGRICRNAIQPWSDVRGSATYRSLLGENFLMKSYHEIRQERG